MYRILGVYNSKILILNKYPDYYSVQRSFKISCLSCLKVFLGYHYNVGL